MGTLLLAVLIGLNLLLLVLAAGLFWQLKSSSQAAEIKELADQAAKVHESLLQRFSAATVDMATRLERTKGDLRQDVTDRLSDGFNGIRSAVDAQLTGGRREQSERLAEVRTELTRSLALTTQQLKTEAVR